MPLVPPPVFSASVPARKAADEDELTRGATNKVNVIEATSTPKNTLNIAIGNEPFEDVFPTSIRFFFDCHVSFTGA